MPPWPPGRRDGPAGEPRRAPAHEHRHEQEQADVLFFVDDTAHGLFPVRMILSDLPTPAEALLHTTRICRGFAQAGNSCALFGIMRRPLAARLRGRRLS